MMAAVALCGVTKSFAHHTGRALMKQRLASLFRRRRAQRFYALRNVSFSLKPGDSLAIVGPNGAGKSTLLSLVAGISFPDEGSIETRGSVAALLELGSGFHPDLTGRENVVLNASLLGLTRKQTGARFDQIVEFSELAGFLEEPLRTYSTGMVMRLAFSVAVNVDPDILIVDEAFAVGDQAFQAKCIRKILEFKHAGKTLLCVSHSTAILEQVCDRGLWLDRGKVVMEGAMREVLDGYQAGVRPQSVHV
jgi:ABC-type polysaccharide/polyol phosphate transport system ATPase subunit